MARRYLGIPATSAAVESSFSVTGCILTKSRNRLLPSKVKQISCMKSWGFTNYEDYLEDWKKMLEDSDDMDTPDESDESDADDE